jgi:hypothetical protein
LFENSFAEQELQLSLWLSKVSRYIFSTFGICISFQKALDVVQMCKEDQERVFKMLTAILWLGNISFEVNDNDNHIEVVNDEGRIHTYA